MGRPPFNVSSKQGLESQTQKGETGPSAGLHCSLLPDSGYNVTSLPKLLWKELFLLKLPLLGILLQY